MKKLFLMLSLFMFSATAVFAETIEVKVKGMVCSFCANGLDKKFKAQESVEKVTVDLKKSILRLELKDDETLADDVIKNTVMDAGYEVESIKRK